MSFCALGHWVVSGNISNIPYAVPAKFQLLYRKVPKYQLKVYRRE